MDRRRGFTLVEMLVVIVIIGLLATLVLVNVTGHVGPATEKITRSMIGQLRGQLDIFKLNHGRYPDRLEDLVRPPAYVDSRTWPAGGYLDEVPLDGWGRAYVYRVPGPDGRPFEILSWGADGRENTEDDLSSRPRS